MANFPLPPWKKVEQAAAAGIERLVIVVAEHEHRDFARLFYEKPSAEAFNRLLAAAQVCAPAGKSTP